MSTTPTSIEGGQLALDLIADAISGAVDGESFATYAPGLELALGAILPMDGPSAADVLREMVFAEREDALDEAARLYMVRRIIECGREPLRALVRDCYPPATPGQDGWSSFLTDYPPAVAIREGAKR